MVKHTFANNLAKNAKLKLSNSRGAKFNAAALLDNNKTTYWATQDQVHEATIELNLPASKTFDIISLQEYIQLGQRIEAYTIEVFENGAWKKVYDGTSIGAKRLIKLDTPVTTNKVKINITKSPVCITLSEIGLYKKTA